MAGSTTAMRRSPAGPFPEGSSPPKNRVVGGTREVGVEVQGYRKVDPNRPDETCVGFRPDRRPQSESGEGMSLRRGLSLGIEWSFERTVVKVS